MTKTFHSYDGDKIVEKRTTFLERKLNYQFYPHFHPYVAELVKRLIEKSVAGLEAADTEYRKDTQGRQVIPAGKPKPEDYAFYKVFFQESYNPNPDIVDKQHPVKDLDFTSSGAYAVYNWELFFHVPFTIAVHLSKNQRFEEAQQWFHYVFDPTDDSDGPTPERFWRVKPFQITDVKMIEEILVNLSSGADPTQQKETINSIDAWKDAPFRPHVIARYRQSAYMLKTVMAYCDNLIAWGDMLFRQDTGESINEATQLYVLAANILGLRPQAVPKKSSVRLQTYASLKKDLDKSGNALAELEADIPFDITPQPTQATGTSQISTLNNIGKALYFCVPRNDKLLAYWDTVADRLFKIRNSLNLQGIFRQLPLFEPPIDPALLAKASAAGLDVGAILSGVNQPLPLVRFQLLAQKAAEICQEVKSLGNNLLSAIEKEDNESLAILRARHERVILRLAETVRYGQWQEAIKNREGLERSIINAVQRYTYYEQLLGVKEADIIIPALDALDADALEKMAFKSSEPEMGGKHIFDIDTTNTPGALTISFQGGGGLGAGTANINPGSGGRQVNRNEVEELNKLQAARYMLEMAEPIDRNAALLAQIPDTSYSIFGVSATGVGGTMLSRIASFHATGYRTIADRFTYEASTAGKIGSYDRRELEWKLQSNLASGEITQTFKQLRASQIREAIAEREWQNHQQQIRHAEDIEHFLNGEKNSSDHKKISTKDFYTWMKREVKGLYGQCFQFAFDVAKKAERALQHELGNPELSFLQFGYLTGKEGLLAGEKLYLDIKRMEMAYHDLNQREYELTKHVSLLQVNPLALLQLRATGRCKVQLPEALFDMDGPSHYFRRIKTVAVSIPCVTGPYASVNCTLTLLKSSIRKTQILHGDVYARENAEDDRFNDYYGSLQSIVTSSAQNDSGLFETNLRDERYLPFENSGVISEWLLELPANPSKGDPHQFDYETISDVLLHLRYTAREGGALLKKGAVANIKTIVEEAQVAGSVRLFSVRHEFPTEWAKFTSVKFDSTTKTAGLSLTLLPQHYPFWAQGIVGSGKVEVYMVELFAKMLPTNKNIDVNLYDNADLAAPNIKIDALNQNPSLGNLLSGNLVNIGKPAVITDATHPPLIVYFDDNKMEELWIAITWGKA